MYNIISKMLHLQIDFWIKVYKQNFASSWLFSGHLHILLYDKISALMRNL